MPKKAKGDLSLERLDIQVSTEQKDLLIAAANACGLTLSAFILSHALREAEAALSEFPRYVFASDRVYDSLLKMINEDELPDRNPNPKWWLG